jgi:hypothetical protein
MRKNRIERRHSLTLVQGGVGQENNPSVYSPFGPVRAGLTTSPRTLTDQPLTELLNDLEKQVATLIYKSSKVLDILEQDTQRLALLLNTTTDTGGIDNV